MFTTLQYYTDKGELIIFNKYEINNKGIVRNQKTKRINATFINHDGYVNINARDSCGKQKQLKLARAVLTTFAGCPQCITYSADHINRNKADNRLENLRWLDKSGQRVNQCTHSIRKDGFIIVHNGEELTSRDWGAKIGISSSSITKRAIIGKDWKYKEYDDIFGEEWRLVENSTNYLGFWMVSNLGRVACHRKYARKVYYSHELGTSSNYPVIAFNGKHYYLHVIVFKTFKNEEYKQKKVNELILHKNDNKIDCGIYNLRIGTHSMNRIDAYDNGKYNGTKSQRRKCIAYKDDEQNEFDSITDATTWLKSIGNKYATPSSIHRCLIDNNNTSYGYKWKEY